MKIETYIKTQTLDRFDSASEYVAAALKRANKEKGQSSVPPQHWSGNVTLEDAARLAINGWPEARDKVAKISGRLVAELSGRIMRQEWIPDVEGEFIDVPLFVSGEPECWRRPELEYSETGSAVRHVRIMVNGAVSASVDPDVIEARGATLAALVDLLELAGDMVTVQLVFNISHGEATEGLGQLITIKRSDERADIGTLTYWLAHPSALRRLAFAYWEGCPEDVQRRFGILGSYGHPADPKLDESEYPDLYFGRAYTGTPGGAGLWTNLTKVREWLSETLGKLGVTVLG
jgi:hypothetical protein